MGHHIDGTAFFGKTYDDALTLLVEVRDYLESNESAKTAQLPPATRLGLTCLTMRLTAQLTDIMAWLLVQKAVQSGEITDAETQDADMQLRRWLNMRPENSELPIPEGLQSLISRSQVLFERVERLESMMIEKQEV